MRRHIKNLRDGLKSKYKSLRERVASIRLPGNSPRKFVQPSHDRKTTDVPRIISNKPSPPLIDWSRKIAPPQNNTLARVVNATTVAPQNTSNNPSPPLINWSLPKAQHRIVSEIKVAPENISKKSFEINRKRYTVKLKPKFIDDFIRHKEAILLLFNIHNDNRLKYIYAHIQNFQNAIDRLSEIFKENIYYTSDNDMNKLMDLIQYYHFNILDELKEKYKRPAASNFEDFFNYEKKFPMHKEHMLPLPFKIGGKKSKKPSKKEILGKMRIIHKIPGDRKEYVKHKGKLITVKDYKKLMKAKKK